MDTDVYQWFNRLADRTGWAHRLFSANATYGIVLFAVLLIAAYLDARRKHDLTAVAASVWAGAAALVALGIGQLIGNAVHRARPYQTLSNVHLLVDKTADFSFPSDHATAAGAVAVGLLYANRRLGIIACVLAALMAITRVYVGAHYPTDVLAGLALGGMIAAIGSIAVVPVLRRLAVRLTRTPLRPLVITRRARYQDLIQPGNRHSDLTNARALSAPTMGRAAALCGNSDPCDT